MNHSLLLPILIPLVAAASMIALPVRARRLQHTIHALATLALLPVAAALWRRAAGGEIAVYALGHWPAPFGIVLQLDRLGALMLALTAVLACCCMLATNAADTLRGRHFRPLFQFQLMGLNGAFVAGDLFNLFVFFELLLIASYALLLHGGDRLRVRNGLHYLVLNLAGSSFFLVALGVLYGVTGTLNMADAGVRLAQLAATGADTLPLARFAGAMLMLVFGLKAALFPMSFWLPQAYRSAIGPVAALFAIMTKVGVYAMVRCDALVFGAANGLLGGFMHDWAWWLAIATMVFGALGALAVQSLKATTGYVVLVSVGLLVAAVSMQTAAAWSALLYYLVSTTLCTAALFVLADVLEPQPQTPEAADELGPRGAAGFVAGFGGRSTEAAGRAGSAAAGAAAGGLASASSVAAAGTGASALDPASASRSGSAAASASGPASTSIADPAADPALGSIAEPASIPGPASAATATIPRPVAAAARPGAAANAPAAPQRVAVAGRPVVSAHANATASPGDTPPSRAAALLFLVAALGAIGLPPLSGFIGKAMVLAATPLSHAAVLWPIVLAAGLVLIVALSRTGTRLLWSLPASYGYARPAAGERIAARPSQRAKLAACALLLACVVAATLGAGPFKRFLDDAAAQLSDRAAYVDAVLHAQR